MNQFKLLVTPPTTIVPSNEGGAVFEVDGATLLDRFLIMGSTSTFYASGADVTQMVTTELRTYLEQHPSEALAQVHRVARERLALRKDPTLYIHAQLTMPDVPESVRRTAYQTLPDVAQTGTDLLHWLAFRYPQGPTRHAGMGFRKALARWFHTHRNLTLQAVKYQQRDGWSLRDAIRLAHKISPNNQENEDFIFIHDKEATKTRYAEQVAPEQRAPLYAGYLAVRETTDPETAAAIIHATRLPREAIPGQLLAHSMVWEALLPDMPARALIRNLGKLSSLNLDRKDDGDFIISRITKAATTLHPFEFLIAKAIYAQGHGMKGSLRWSPNHFILQALEAAYVASYKGLTVSKGKPLIALDTSASMTSKVGGTPLQALEAAAALASVLAYQYPNAEFFAYSNGLTRMDPRNHGTDAFMAEMRRLEHVGTRCALPLEYVSKHPQQQYTAVISITDSETADGAVYDWRTQRTHQPRCADLVRMIQASQHKDFRHGVVAMATNKVSLADPRDPRQLDFVGMSADLPVGIARFLAGV